MGLRRRWQQCSFVGSFPHAEPSKTRFSGRDAPQLPRLLRQATQSAVSDVVRELWPHWRGQRDTVWLSSRMTASEGRSVPPPSVPETGISENMQPMGAHVNLYSWNFQPKPTQNPHPIAVWHHKVVFGDFLKINWVENIWLANGDS